MFNLVSCRIQWRCGALRQFPWKFLSYSYNFTFTNSTSIPCMSEFIWTALKVWIHSPKSLFKYKFRETYVMIFFFPKNSNTFSEKLMWMECAFFWRGCIQRRVWCGLGQRKPGSYIRNPRSSCLGTNGYYRKAVIVLHVKILQFHILRNR